MQKRLKIGLMICIVMVIAACGKEADETSKEKDEEVTTLSENQKEVKKTEEPVKEEEGDEFAGYDKKGIEKLQSWKGMEYRIADVDVFQKQDVMNHLSYRAGDTVHFTVKAYYDSETTFDEFISVPLEGYETEKEAETVHEVAFEEDGIDRFGGQYRGADGNNFSRFVIRVDNMFYEIVYFASAEEYNTYLPDLSFTMESIDFDRGFTKNGK